MTSMGIGTLNDNPENDQFHSIVERLPCRALLLGNRNSRRGHAVLKQAIGLLSQGGIDVIEGCPSASSEINDLIRAHRSQIDLVVVVGGDGTLNSAAEALVETKLPLGIVPAGTANDLARTLGISTNVIDACQTILNGRPRTIDVGWVNGKHYFNVASLGISVKITEQLSKQQKRRWGVIAYLIAATQVVIRSRPFRASIRTDSTSFDVRTVQIAVGNGRHYGGGLTVADTATIDDGQLDLYSVEIESWWQILPLIVSIYRGNLHASRHVRTLRGTSFEVVVNSQRRVNTDGELTTVTPAIFRIIPQALNVLVPLNPEGLIHKPDQDLSK